MQAQDYAAVAGTFLIALLVSRLVRWPIVAGAARLGIPAALVPWLLLGPALAIPCAWPHRAFAAVMVCLLALLSWKAASMDIDLGGLDALWSERAFLAVSAVLSAFHPTLMLPNLWIQYQRFDAFNHHGSLPLRVLLLGFGFVVHWNVAGWLGAARSDLSPAVISILACHAMAYWVPARTKARLGPHWYSWMLDNRLHHVMASAYSWGWPRFMAPRAWSRLVGLAARLNVPMQVGAFTFEASTILQLLDRRLAIVLMIAAVGFHLSVFLTTGILFWEWMATNLLLVWMLEAGGGARFGVGPFMVSLALAAIWWWWGADWRPKPLGWWDTPFTQRVDWEVVGESGRVYGAYNDFMCPHERLYGRVHGRFMTNHRICTFHLGEVMDRELRDAIWAARGTADLERIKLRWGVDFRDQRQRLAHLTYLNALFRAVNAGKRKFVYPRWLRWLKAPGGQYYYWGSAPAFRGQERVVEVRVAYREEWFDGAEYRVVNHQPLARIDLSAPEASDTAEAPGARTAWGP